MDLGLLAHFGKKKPQAMKSYQSFVEEINPSQLEDPGKEIVAGCILGEMGFVSWVQRNYIDRKEMDNELPQLKALRPKVSLEAIMRGITHTTGCTSEQIRAKGGKKNQAREMAIYLARDISGLSGRELGEYFGGMSGAAITMRYKQFGRKLSEDKKLQQLTKKAKTAILNF